MRFAASPSSWARRVRRLVWLVILVVFISACGTKPQAETFILRVYDDTPTPAVAIGQGVPTSSSAGAAEGATALFSPVPEATSTLPSAQNCPLPALTNDQHLSSSSSYTMTEDEAAGPMVCQIERNSCAYNLLVTDRDPNTGFGAHKPAPLTDEDRLMHPAMVMPLTRLSQLVQQEWRGEVNLFVSAAYDSTGEHDLNQTDLKRKYSLHFEGRSLDLIVSPWDPAKLDRLCALAYCAGFDWVHNEGDHCHVSVSAPSLCSFCSGSVPTPPATPSSQLSSTSTP